MPLALEHWHHVWSLGCQLLLQVEPSVLRETWRHFRRCCELFWCVFKCPWGERTMMRETLGPCKQVAEKIGLRSYSYPQYFFKTHQPNGLTLNRISTINTIAKNTNGNSNHSGKSDICMFFLCVRYCAITLLSLFFSQQPYGLVPVTRNPRIREVWVRLLWLSASAYNL